MPTSTAVSPLRTLPAALLLALGLTACGGGSSTPDNPAAAAASRGVLVDDLVINATVFCDSNNDGIRQAGEATAVTGDDGSYTFTPACTAQVASVAGTGYDRMTRKSPKGVFRSQAGSTYVSPFTTMQIASGLTTEQFAQVMRRLGLDSTVTDAGQFNPVTHASGRTGAAVIKVLNQISEIVEAAGGDGSAAWNAAARAMVTWVQNNLSGTTSVFDDDTDVQLADFIRTVAAAGFAVVPTGTWSDAAKANAASVAAEGLKRLARRILAHTRYEDIGNDFSDGSIGGIISDTNLDDDNEVEGARGRCRGNTFSSQYVALAGDAFTISGPGLAGGHSRYTLAQLANGIHDFPAGTTLASLTRIELPLQATALGLPRRGQKIELALEIQEVGGGNRLLQFMIDKIELSQATREPTANPVTASLSSNSELLFYSRSAAGIEAGTGEDGVKNFDRSVLVATNTGVALDLTALTASLRSRFPAHASLINGILAARGTFEFKWVISEVDLRHDAGNDTGRYTMGRVSVLTPKDANGVNQVAERLNGAVVNGRLTF